MTRDYINATDKNFVLFGIEDGKVEIDKAEEVVSILLDKVSRKTIYNNLINYYYGYKLGRLKSHFDNYVPQRFWYSEEYNTIVNDAMPKGVFSKEVEDSMKMNAIEKTTEILVRKLA